MRITYGTFLSSQDAFGTGIRRRGKIGQLRPAKHSEVDLATISFSYHCQIATAETLQVTHHLQTKSQLPSWPTADRHRTVFV